MRANHRASSFDTTTVRRTGSVYLGFPIRAFSLNTGGEFGVSEGPRGTEPLGFYNANLRWAGDQGFGSLVVSQVQNGAQPVQRRLDVLGSVKMGQYRGVGRRLGHGGLSRRRPSRHLDQPGRPIFLDLTAVVGVEYRAALVDVVARLARLVLAATSADGAAALLQVERPGAGGRHRPQIAWGRLASPRCAADGA